MGVHVDWEVRELLSEGSYKKSRGLRSQKTSHVLDCEEIDTVVDELPSEVKIVVE